ncbi:MAG: hypothetical protein ACPL5F_04990 [Moorellaceae bacterium]
MSGQGDEEKAAKRNKQKGGKKVMKVTFSDCEVWTTPSGQRRKWARNNFEEIKTEQQFFACVRHMARRLNWVPEEFEAEVRQRGPSYCYSDGSLEWNFFWWADGTVDAYIEGLY